MSKFGYLSVPVILFAMAFSASAQDGKNVGTNADRSQDVLDVDIWLDGEVGYGYGTWAGTTTGTDGSFYQNTQLGFNVGFNDSVSGALSLNTGFNYGSEEDGSIGDDLNFDLYNLSFADAFTEGLTVTFGSTHQTFGLNSNELWYNPYRVGTGQNGAGSRRNTGLFLDYASDNMSVHFGWSVMDDAGSSTSDDSHVMLSLTYGLDSVSEGSAIGLMIVENNGAADASVMQVVVDSHWAGLVEGLDIGLGIGFNSGDLSGTRIALNLSYDLGMDNGAWVGAKFVMASGNDGDDEEWGGLNSSTGAMALNQIESYENGGAAIRSNITIMAIGGGMSFDMGSGKNNASVSILLGIADQTEGDDSYGTEIDVNFDHTINSNVAWGAHIGYVSSSDTGFGDGTDDSSYLITFPVNFSF